LNQKIWFK